MDPQATLQRWVDAILEGNKSEAIRAYVDLKGWMDRGGFEPKWEPLQRRALFRFGDMKAAGPMD